MSKAFTRVDLREKVYSIPTACGHGKRGGLCRAHPQTATANAGGVAVVGTGSESGGSGQTG